MQLFVQENGFALWDLLLGICFAIAVPSAVHSAQLAGVGIAGYALAAVVGLFVGVTCAFSMWKLGEIVGARAENITSDSRKSAIFRLLYLSTIVWIFASALAAEAISSWLLRLVM
jgi:hypothetical protein